MGKSKKKIITSKKLKTLRFKRPNTIKILDSEGKPLSLAQQSFFAKEDIPFSPNFSPIKLTQKSSSGKQKAISKTKSHQIFMRELRTSQYSLWREMTPGTEKNSPHTLKFSNQADLKKIAEISERLEFDTDIDYEEFKFEVTAKDLKTGARNVKQNTVMRGISAKEYLKAFGANLISITEKQVRFHWAHRQAWFMNGPQSKKNLDAMTAAGNLHTLLKVETPIKKLLLSKQAQKINVQGTVYFQDLKQRTAKSISYHFSWGKNKSCTVEIDPMNVRFPSREEIQATKLVIEQEACGLKF